MFKYSFILTLLLLVIANTFAEDFKFAVVNTDRILEESKDGKKVQGILSALEEEWNSQINSKESQYKAAYDAYLNQPPMATEEFKKQKEEELSQLEEEYLALQKEINKKAQKKQNELLLPIFEKLGAITDNIAKQKNYRAIFDVTLTGFVYVDSTLDITDIIIQEMDKGVK
ncbi:MAG: OmpH family outer membrane protein [Candidatus Cloacimonetes bacterium]|nr:OmpH family outer membrane protein [Candidatus Cloacimonadota bacterium]